MKKIVTLIAAASFTLTGIIHAEKLVIKGSDTIGAKLVPQLAEAFKAKHPDATFEIAAEGSTTGIAAVIDGTAQIGMASRRAKMEEVSKATGQNKTLKPTIIAHDGMCCIVHASNPLNGLTKKQVEQIFTGDVTDWSAVGGKAGAISVYTRNTSSGTYSEWKEMAMKKRDYASSSQKMAGNEQIAAEVGKNPNGIGYVGLAYANAKGIKVIAVEGQKPEPGSIRNGSYPYSRLLYYYTNGEPTGIAKQFVDFTLSPAGQAIVNQVHFVSNQ